MGHGRKINVRASGKPEKFDIVTDYHGVPNKVGKVTIEDKQMSTHDKLHYYLDKLKKNKK